MIIARTATKLSHELGAITTRGSRRFTSLVTTGGRLHDGQGAVINAANTISDLLVVAIAPQENEGSGNVVTADQFSDISFLEQHDVDVLFAPSYQALFPRPPAQMYRVSGPENDSILSPDVTRLTLHLKLINAVQPDIVVWGEKNFIDYFHVRQMIGDLGLAAQMQCVPTVRHADGVAVCAKESALSPEQRARLPVLYSTLGDVVHAIRDGARTFKNLEKTARVALRGADMEVELFAILDANQLTPADDATTSFRIIGQVSIDGVQITDSLGLTL